MIQRPGDQFATALHSESRPTLSLSNPYEINFRYNVEGLIPRISDARFF
jgi:hypothetical protein